MSVNSVTLYSYTDQYQVFGNAVSESRIKDLMQKYGIKPSGDKHKDLEALYQAIYSEAKSEVSSSEKISALKNLPVQPEKTEEPTVPWATIMRQIGLTPTGEYESDYNLFNQKINSMLISSSSAQEKASIYQISAQAELVFVKPPETAGKTAQSEPIVSSLDILSQLNKLYLFD